MAESLTPLIQTIHDSLMVLAPGGWTQLELRFVQSPDGLRLSELNARGDGSKAPRPRPDLHIDPKLEAERLSEGVSELQQLLAQQKKATWTPGTLTVSRTPDFADYKLLKPDGSTAWFTRLQKEHLDSLLMTDALFDMMEGSQRAFHDLQGRLEARLKNTTGFSFEPQLSSLSLRQKEGPPLELPALVIGQYYPDAFTWTWGWAREDANPHTVERVRRVCAPDVTQPGLSALWRSQFHCDEGFAWTLAGSIVVSLGARGLFRAELPQDEGVIFFALMADP
jgi:hypothetical protein